MERVGCDIYYIGYSFNLYIFFISIISYKSQWIKIGDGKIIICRRVPKKIKLDPITGWEKPAGWIQKIDEILVEEIETWLYTRGIKEYKMDRISR